MNEEELRNGLRAAVTEEPPMRLDPDRMATKAETHTRRRRSMLGAAVGTLAVVGAVAIAPGLAGQGGVNGTAGVISSSMAPPPPPAEERRELSGPEQLELLPAGFMLEEPAFNWPPADVSAPNYSKGELYERTQDLRPYLKDRFAEVAPEASVVDPSLFGTAGFGDLDDGSQTVDSAIYFIDSQGDGGAFVSVMAAGSRVTDQLCHDSDLACGYLVLDDDSLLVASVSDPRRGMRPSIISVTHLRHDGEAVRFAGYDYNPTGVGEVNQREQPSLSYDQLIELATDEEITVF
ncbi:hypothetical protein BKA25_000228 [Actinoalloteichus hymeniacidonis]|nr:hypothetical protein [Actinoalloteichus hymeniacidonis]